MAVQDHQTVNPSGNPRPAWFIGHRHYMFLLKPGETTQHQT
jgi:hypothetical protein